MKYTSGAVKVTVTPLGGDRYRCTVSLSDRRFVDRPRRVLLNIAVAMPSVYGALGLDSTPEDAAHGALDLAASSNPCFGNAAIGTWGTWRIEAVGRV